ncbi:MAG: Ditrans,polycis-undecaprenyl-diphosphate synthase ((2E,6E)-farnesyl-diphosphate specific) [Fimbriimonadaceae bacterium]|nr:Ditrans,polycis-undecaprenyl-diphosphate synthase ((2E,6E)-farnesyl-diphosphate specific) [Fimbriimonadaceae bacterium]
MTVASNSIQQQAVAKGIDLERLPQHVAIIMDGNGRWAQRRGLGRLMGHRQGYRILRDILLAASELGIRYLTVYAFSAENWRRPADEVQGLMKLIEEAARNELRVMHRNNVRVRAAGRMDELPSGLRQALEDGIDTTRNNTGITFTLAVNYGGRAEIVDAVKRIVSEGLVASEIDEDSIASRLYTTGTPDPDVIVRTAGEQRWSNFLLWQAAYAELVVVDVPWPEFNEGELLAAILSYQTRTRKFGGLDES